MSPSSNKIALFIDGANLYATAKMSELGFKYHSIGRVGVA